MKHTMILELTVEADARKDAHEVAIAACEHLADTFNDDGSISASTPPLSMSPASPDGMAALLQRFIDWNAGHMDGGALLKLIEDAAALLEHGDAALPVGEAITITLTVSEQTCYDIMCTATEGGINYWADIIARQWKGRRDEDRDIISFEADVQDGPVQCDHPDIPAAEIGRFTCDPAMIRQGIARLLAPGALVSPAIRNDVLLQAADPEHACDANSADSIVQFGLFGELVFG